MDNKQIINEIIKAYGLKSQSDLAKCLGVSPQLLNYWINNSLDIHKIKETFPNISTDWLITGEGVINDIQDNSGTIVNNAGHDNFFTPSTEREDESELVRHLREEVEYLRNLVNNLTSK